MSNTRTLQSANKIYNARKIHYTVFFDQMLQPRQQIVHKAEKNSLPRQDTPLVYAMQHAQVSFIIPLRRDYSADTDQTMEFLICWCGAVAS